MQSPESLPEFVGAHEVRRRLGIGSTTLQRMIQCGEFPRPVRVGLRRVAWPLPEVQAWLADRLRERDSAA